MDKDKKEAMPYGAPRSPEDTGDAGKGDDGSRAKPEGSGKEGDGGGALYADKYKTDKELEEAYKSSQAKIGEQGSELDKLRKQNEFLSEQLKGSPLQTLLKRETGIQSTIPPLQRTWRPTWPRFNRC